MRRRRNGLAILAALAASALGCSSAQPDPYPGTVVATGGAGAAPSTGGTGPVSPAGFSCQVGQTLCGISCVFLDSDPAHCGSCNNACPAGTSCVGGQCTCQAGLISCNGQCVDITSDAQNCGVCGNVCDAGAVCSRGVCAASCDEGLTQCGQSCVDLGSNVLHCGACDNPCPAGRLCQGGVCACERSTDTDCSGVCVDTQTDPANCGSCGNACADGATCSAGVCVGGGVGGSGGSGDVSTGGTGATGAGGGAATGGATASGGDGAGGTGNTAGGASGPEGFINEQGKVVADSNAFGIQGDWYAFSDGVTSEQTGNPYRDGMYCITGEAPGDEDHTNHWGVGLGLDLNGVDGEKLPYEFEGRITGFRMTLVGTIPTTARVQFVNDLENDVSPFVPVTLDESTVYWIAEAQVPLSWGVDNAGARVDNGVLYSIQVLVPGAEAAGPIDLCLTEFEPIYDPDNVPVVDDGPFINSDGYVLAENNDYGIQGPVYAISDGNSSTQTGNPYSDGRYCIAGEFTGADDDWGAGIAFDLNKAPGGAKEAYAHDGVIEGFRIGLSGNTPGAARIQFIINEPQEGTQPFLAAVLNTTTVYRIDWAQVPTSWDVSNAGQEVGDSIYTVQVFLDGEDPGPFDVCIEEFVPLTASELAVNALPATAGYNGARTVDAAMLSQEYQTWKARHFHDCNDGTACIPRDEGDCISEGVGYGMLLAVAHDDRDAFDKLWAYYEQYKNSYGVMDWQTNACGSVIGTGSATDGDLDAAMALIQAGCKWGGSYETQARDLISAIRNSAVTYCSDRTVLMPGANFGGCSETNPSYIAPGYYKAFEALTGDSTWTDLANDGYVLLETLQSRMNGLVPNWTDADGNVPSGDRGEYGPDASRTPWRVATDYVWNNDQRAIAFLDNVSAYVDSNGGIARLFAPASNYRGALAMSGWHQASAKAQEYTDAWLTTSVDDKSYYPGTLRQIYLLLAAHQFPNGCN